MKILAFSALHGQRPTAETVTLYPDSSVITTRKPLFLPDWSDTFATQAALAVRVSRLGKHIAPRFAHRYWDAATICLVTTSASDERHDALSQAFDGAIALGEWVETQHLANMLLDVRLNDERWLLPSLPVEDLVHEAITAASERMTIKMGDVFCLKLGEPKVIAIGDTVNGLLNEQEVLTIKIK
ncbi:MAG: hypothetical protein IJ775_06610 [Muribaculaceae bacterium]|nr:hypothetical protein [Muribaculaceae bacterium]